MKGYITRKNNHWYVVIYEGLDPTTGRERRGWHPAGTDRTEAETLSTSPTATIIRLPRCDGLINEYQNAA